MFGHDDKHHDDEDGQDGQGQEMAPDAPAHGADDNQHHTDDNQHGAQHDQGQGHGGQDHGGQDHSEHGAPDGEGQGQDAGSSDDGAWQHPNEPLGDEPADSAGDAGGHDENTEDKPEQISDIIPGSGNDGDVPPMPMPPRNLTDDGNDDGKLPHELIDIKQKALGQLSPLMGQLELGPEDRFRTLMMVIQANDNQDLLKQAYEAADAIEDEKVRAQALLDIVNEITYFTQHPAPEN
ncbi:MAG: hypothetical protein ACREJM_02950 [Candidatus Saccharimonadales bacterium]